MLITDRSTAERLVRACRPTRNPIVQDRRREPPPEDGAHDADGATGAAPRRASAPCLTLGALADAATVDRSEPIQSSQPTVAFDAVAYVDGFVATGASTRRSALAVDAPRPFRRGGSARRPGRSDAPPIRTALFVKVTGVVTEVNLRSRVGLARSCGSMAPRRSSPSPPGRSGAQGHGAARCDPLPPLHRFREPVRVRRRGQRTQRSGPAGRCSDRSNVRRAFGAAMCRSWRRIPLRWRWNDPRRSVPVTLTDRRSRRPVMAPSGRRRSSRQSRSPSRSPAPWRSTAWTSASTVDAFTRSSARTAPGNRRCSRSSPASSSRPRARLLLDGHGVRSPRPATPRRGASA